MIAWARRLTVAALCCGAAALPARSVLGFDLNLSREEAQIIGRKIWENECAGTIDGLTSWNKGEAFASLGIGHFIWYPPGMDGPFQESFPGMVEFVRAIEDAPPPPAWLLQLQPFDCPWTTRESFMADFRGERLNTLRQWLADTVPFQTECLIHRLAAAVPLMTERLGESDQERVMLQFLRVLRAPGGAYPLIDYVNFKGEGTKETERYKGQGWGLLQVLLEMKGGEDTRVAEEGDTELADGGAALDSSTALVDFSDAAKTVLRRRIANSPPDRNEKRWLQGWMNRCDTYRRPLE